MPLTDDAQPESAEVANGGPDATSRGNQAHRWSRKSRVAGVRVAPAVMAAHLATLLVGLVVVSYYDRRQWFFGDEWDFILDRGLSGAQSGIWTPHNEHWSTLPILLYRALFSVFGVRTYVPYLAALIIAHLFLAHLIWRVCLRVGTDPWIATGLVGVFLVLGAGSENLVWAFQIGFVASVMFGYVALWLVDHEDHNRGRDMLAWAALVAALMCSGIGVSMVAVSGLAILLWGGWGAWRRALFVVAVPAATFLVWFTLAGRKGLTGDQLGLTTLLNIPTYIWTGLTSAFERTSGIPGSGAVLVVLLIGWIIARVSREVRSEAPALALAMGTVLLFVVIALGRTRLGVNEAVSPRYAYLGLALLIPSIGVALTQLAGARANGRWVLVSVLAFFAVTNVSLLRLDANARINRDQPLERQILAAAALLASGQPIVADNPEPVYEPNITAKTLLPLYRDGKLPSIALTPADRAAAATQLQIAVGDSGSLHGSIPPLMVMSVSDSSDGTCDTLEPTGRAPQVALMVPTGGATVQLTSSDGGDIGVSLRLANGGMGPVRTFTLLSGHPVFLSASAIDAVVTVSLPPTGTLRLCRSSS